MAEDGNENTGGSKKKMMIIILAVVIVAIGVFVSMSLFGDKEEEVKKGSKEKKVELGDYEPNDFPEKELLVIDLGEITASIPSPAAGNKNRKRIKMHPYLLLSPFLSETTKEFDKERNNFMVNRYKSAIPLLRQIILETVNEMEASQGLGPKEMAEKLKSSIKFYDDRHDYVTNKYGYIFGKRVLKVCFHSYEPR